MNFAFLERFFFSVLKLTKKNREPDRGAIFVTQILAHLSFVPLGGEQRCNYNMTFWRNHLFSHRRRHRAQEMIIRPERSRDLAVWQEPKVSLFNLFKSLHPTVFLGASTLCFISWCLFTQTPLFPVCLQNTGNEKGSMRDGGTLHDGSRGRTHHSAMAEICLPL